MKTGNKSLGRVAVAVCGSDALVANVRNLNVSMSSSTKITFDHHEESFSF